VTTKQNIPTQDTRPDWIIDAKGTRVGQVGRRQHYVHITLALLVMVSGCYFCLLGISAGIFSTGRDASPRSPVEDRLLAVFDEIQREPYAKLVDRKPESRVLETNDADHKYRLNLSFEASGVNLMQITGVLIDYDSGKEVDRLQTYRSKRD